MVDIILLVLVFVGLGVFVIASLIIKIRGDKEGQEAKDSTEKEKTSQECLHFYGYLADHPRNQPIPDECLSCIRAMDCMKAQKREMS